MSDDADAGCRADVWLWRARFFKTRALACRAVEDGRVRLTRGGAEVRLDKASRTLRPGDILVFAVGGRVMSVRFQAPGLRRGPAAEARALYEELGPSGGGSAAAAERGPEPATR